MGETISFCKKYNLPEPSFGTWDLWNGGDKFPAPYNSDHFIGGHDGTQQDIKDTFPNLNWKEDLVANFDTKFIINDMFRFGRVDELDFVRDKLQVTKSLNEKTASLHLR